MAKTKISEYDATAANNTDINSINIAEGCAPSGINNAIRETMAALKRFQTGADGDPLTVGGNLVVTGNATLGDASGDSVTINAATTTFAQGTANGVTYLNGSKVLTSGSALTFDGTSKLSVSSATGSASPTPSELQIATTTSASDWSTTSPWGRLSFYSADTSLGAKTQVAIDTVADTTTGGFSSLSFSLSNQSSGTLTERMRITSAGTVGIGTSSPNNLLHINGGAADTALQITNSATGSTVTDGFSITVENPTPDVVIRNRESANMRFLTANTERMRIDSSGNVGIGTSSPGAKLEVAGEIEAGSIEGGTNGQIIIRSRESSDFTRTSIGSLRSSGAAYFGRAVEPSTTVDNGFNGGLTGTTGGGAWVISSDGGTYYTAFPSAAMTKGSALTMQERMRIDSSGNVFIGNGSTNASPANGVLSATGGSGTDIAGASLTIRGGASTGSGAGGPIIFSTAAAGASGTTVRSATERMRIDSSGNLLVGKTSADGAATTGVEVRADGSVRAARASTVGVFNRLSTDGNIVEFEKAGTNVGRIGINGSYFFLSQSNTGILLDYGDSLAPSDGSGAIADNQKDVGHSANRWDDIYATNGTIQTSDRNEKQDIEELSEAEQRVAVAAKALLRKFRWKDAVAEKGDEARIHFGIIAQDLQAAFEAEGLDAGRYAMFIHSEWTDEETGEQRSRMGVRYSELLSFIIAAI